MKKGILLFGAVVVAICSLAKYTSLNTPQTGAGYGIAFIVSLGILLFALKRRQGAKNILTG